MAARPARTFRPLLALADATVFQVELHGIDEAS
jgi:hypothetical protein